MDTSSKHSLHCGRRGLGVHSERKLSSSSPLPGSLLLCCGKRGPFWIGSKTHWHLCRQRGTSKIQRKLPKYMWVNVFRVPLCKRPFMDALGSKRKSLISTSLKQTYAVVYFVNELGNRFRKLKLNEQNLNLYLNLTFVAGRNQGRGLYCFHSKRGL